MERLSIPSLPPASSILSLVVVVAVSLVFIQKKQTRGKCL